MEVPFYPAMRRYGCFVGLNNRKTFVVYNVSGRLGADVLFDCTTKGVD
jgi:hypothetical protein